MNPLRNEISLRIRPEAEEGFTDRFTKDMEQQLAIGPYQLDGITAIKNDKKNFFSWYTGDNLRSVTAITGFLLANIFLGIIGTFWSKIQSRRSELGLRLALGSSKKKIHRMLHLETFIMLFISSVVATYICMNLGQTEFLQALGIPAADRVQAGMGMEQDLFNYLFTFLLLQAIAALAVWYPARLSTRVPPADTLREE